MPARLLLILAFVLSAAGIFVAGDMSLHHATGVDLACAKGSDCVMVAEFVRKNWGGFPVAYLGLAGYLAIALLTGFEMFSGPTKRNQKLLRGLTTFGFVVSIALTLFSKVVIQTYCSWCLGSAAVMTLLFVTHLLLRKATTAESKEPKWLSPAVAVVAPLAAVIGIYQVSPVPFMMAFGLDISSKAIEGMTVEDFMPPVNNSLGEENAPVVVVEFGDLMCPHCRATHMILRKKIKDSKGKLRTLWRHFPLIGTPGHEQSLLAAVVSEVCAEHGKFWQFFELVTQKDPKQTTAADVLDWAESLGISRKEIEDKAPDEASAPFRRMRDDQQQADKFGVKYTPTFFIGEKGQQVKLQLQKTFITEIDNLLKKHGIEPSTISDTEQPTDDGHGH